MGAAEQSDFDVEQNTPTKSKRGRKNKAETVEEKCDKERERKNKENFEFHSEDEEDEINTVMSSEKENAVKNTEFEPAHISSNASASEDIDQNNLSKSKRGRKKKIETGEDNKIDKRGREGNDNFKYNLDDEDTQIDKINSRMNKNAAEISEFETDNTSSHDLASDDNEYYTSTKTKTGRKTKEEKGIDKKQREVKEQVKSLELPSDEENANDLDSDDNEHYTSTKTKTGRKTK